MSDFTSSSIEDVVRSLNYDDKGNKRIIVKWGSPSEGKYEAVGYEIIASLVNHAERMVDMFKSQVGTRAGDYFVFPVGNIQEGIDMYQQIAKRLGGKSVEEPERLGNVNEKSQIHLLLYIEPILEYIN